VQLLPGWTHVTPPLTKSACPGSAYSRETQNRPEETQAAPEPFV